MKNIFTILIFALISNIAIAQTVQGNIKRTDDYQVTLYTKADMMVSNTNDFAMLLTVSIDADGATDTNTAPTPVATSSLAGAAIAPQPVQIINGRFVYAYSLTGATPISWDADVENPVLVVDFPISASTTGELVQLNDYTASDITQYNAYFYVELQAIDVTNYPMKFYIDPDQNVTNSEFNDSFVEALTPLPITLTTFTATKRSKSVDLTWVTSTEINGSHFEIERSQDGEKWTNIGKVAAIGESSTTQEYSFLDNKLPLGERNYNKTFYYRLNMVDNDGSQEYSDIRRVSFDLNSNYQFLVYPNPTTDEVFVNLSSITEGEAAATMNIFDLKGQIVKNVTISSNDDIRVDISTLLSGLYYFTVKQNNKVYTQKVLKID